MIKPSMFNHICEYREGWLLFNSVNGLNRIIFLNREKDYLIENITNTDYRTQLHTDSNIDFLYEQGFFIDEDTDEKALRELYYTKERMSGRLHLVINVTSRCNFRCKYCGLRFSDCEDMSYEVQQAIVTYVKKNISKYQSVLLDWFGGEPTLAMDIIDNISSQMSSY